MNEYFAKRWWELDILDYKQSIDICLISAEDLLTKLKRKDRILIDVRPFDKYQACHIKGSFNMDGSIVPKLMA